MHNAMFKIDNQQGPTVKKKKRRFLVPVNPEDSENPNKDEYK